MGCFHRYTKKLTLRNTGTVPTTAKLFWAIRGSGYADDEEELLHAALTQANIQVSTAGGGTLFYIIIITIIIISIIIVVNKYASIHVSTLSILYDHYA